VLTFLVHVSKFKFKKKIYSLDFGDRYASRNFDDAPPDSRMDSTVSPKVKTTKGEGFEMHSLAHNTLGVKGRAGALGWGLRRMTSKSITHTDLQKPNNKLVNA
jgi:hypothetical protein